MAVLKYKDPVSGEVKSVGAPSEPVYTSQQIDTMLQDLRNELAPKTYTTTVGTSWTANGDYFYQDIAVPGILSTDTPIVDILPGDDNSANKTYSDSICKVFRITTSVDSIRVWATEAIESAFPIQLKVVR